jgi:hypothetical protein
MCSQVPALCLYQRARCWWRVVGGRAGEVPECGCRWRRLGVEVSDVRPSSRLSLHAVLGSWMPMSSLVTGIRRCDLCRCYSHLSSNICLRPLPPSPLCLAFALFSTPHNCSRGFVIFHLSAPSTAARLNLAIPPSPLRPPFTTHLLPLCPPTTAVKQHIEASVRFDHGRRFVRRQEERHDQGTALASPFAR